MSYNRSGYDIKEAVRKLASAVAYRALFLQDGERPSHGEKTVGLAVAVALYYDLDEIEIEQFIDELQNYIRVRKEESMFRDPSLYE